MIWNIKKGENTKTFISCILLCAATVFGILALILYLAKGRTQFDPNYSVYAIVGMILGIVTGIAGVITVLKPVAFASYLAFLYAFIHYIVSQVNLIANILYGVDGSSFPPVFFVTVVVALLAFVLALVAGIMMKKVEKA